MVKNTLSKSYRKNIDYKITKVIKPFGKGGQKCKKIRFIICTERILNCLGMKSKENLGFPYEPFLFPKYKVKHNIYK